MKLKKGLIVEVRHKRKGEFIAVVLRDFDTEDEVFWPLAIAKGYVRGLNETWTIGEEIPCRGRLVSNVEALAGLARAAEGR